MWHIGIDLHRRTVVIAAVNDSGEVRPAMHFECGDTAGLVQACQALHPFRCVVEASGTYRWLYNVLAPHGTVLLAHPFRLRALVQRRSKTDKLDWSAPQNVVQLLW